jgi:hypothetical protein
MTTPRLVARIEAEEPSRRLAVLIDADNAQAAVIAGLLEEVARFGEATVKRIYGDFTSPNSAQWKKVLQKHAINPVQQYAYTSGKNATDSRLIIDAMDLLYTRRIDGFCLVSSDSDFTGLAVRIREEGLIVFGFGEQKTPEAFRSACHKFILTEMFRRPEASVLQATVQSAPIPVPLQNTREFPRELLLKAIEGASDEAGWAHLGAVGNLLNKVQPDFDSRVFGFKKLSDLVASRADLFAMDTRMPHKNGLPVMYVRAK